MKHGCSSTNFWLWIQRFSSLYVVKDCIKFSVKLGTETGNELSFTENIAILALTHNSLKGTPKFHTLQIQKWSIVQQKKNYSLALSLCFIHSFSPSFLSVFHRPAGGFKMRMGSTSPHLPNKRVEKRLRERGADGCHGEKERGDPRQMTCSFTLKSFIPLHLTQSTSCQHLSITVRIKQHNRNSSSKSIWMVINDGFLYGNKSDDKIIRLFWS